MGQQISQQQLDKSRSKSSGGKAVITKIGEVVGKPSTEKTYNPSAYRAVFIGIDYGKTEYSLSDCISDSNKIKEVILEKFPRQKTLMIHLRDDVDVNSPYYPTRRNIIRALKWALSSSTVSQFDSEIGDNEFNELIGDEFVFLSYSGHGSKPHDLHDGDEVICPVLNGEFDATISDIEMSETIIPLGKSEVVVVAITDTYHSGASMHLPYVLGHRSVSKRGKYAPLPFQVMKISGRRDNRSLSDDGGHSTAAWISVMSKESNLSLLNLMSKIGASVNSQVNSSRQIPKLSLSIYASPYTKYPL